MRMPGLALTVTETLERGPISFGGSIVVDGESQDCEREVAQQLAALRRLSRDLPEALITIAAIPDGGVLRLANGSFGDDEDELAPILGLLKQQRWQVYCLFRIDEDAHAHLTEL